WVPSELPPSTKMTSAPAMVSPPGRREPMSPWTTGTHSAVSLPTLSASLEQAMTIETSTLFFSSGIAGLCLLSLAGGMPRLAQLARIRHPLQNFLPNLIGQAQRAQTVLGGNHWLPACTNAIDEVLQFEMK